MGREFYKPYYPFDKDDYGMEYPLFAWPFNTDTCYEETNCSQRME